MSKKRKPSRKQKPSFKAPASPNVASANKPSEKTQPSLKTPNVTRGSESQPPSPPSPSLAKPPTPPLLSETGRSARARAMPYTTEQFVRGAVGELLRGAAHGKFWCQTCLAKFALETLGAGYHKRDIGRAMDKVFEAPSPLNRIPAFVCAQCGRTMPCLGVPTP